MAGDRRPLVEAAEDAVALAREGQVPVARRHQHEAGRERVAVLGLLGLEGGGLGQPLGEAAGVAHGHVLGDEDGQRQAGEAGEHPLHRRHAARRGADRDDPVALQPGWRRGRGRPRRIEPRRHAGQRLRRRARRLQRLDEIVAEGLDRDVGRVRLLDEGDRAGRERRHRRGRTLAAVGRDDHDGRRPLLHDPPQQVHAGPPGQLKVEDHHVGLQLAEQPPALLRAPRHPADRQRRLALQQQTEQLLHRRAVVHHKKPMHLTAHQKTSKLTGALRRVSDWR